MSGPIPPTPREGWLFVAFVLSVVAVYLAGVATGVWMLQGVFG